MNEVIISVIKKTVKKLYGIELQEVKLENPPKKDLWDLAFGCFVLSKDTKKNPAVIAWELVVQLKWSEHIEEVSSDGPYLNIKISKNVYTDAFHIIYEKKMDFLNPFIKNGRSIIVDYIWANVWKPLHIGHMCTPNQGQVLINIYKKLGYDVISDSHIGDWGIIFGKLLLAYKLWWDEKKLQENAVDYLLELYVKITKIAEWDDVIEQDTRDEFKLLSEGDSQAVKLWAEFTKHSIEAMNVQLGRLHIKPDYNIGESFYERLGLPKMEDYPDLKFDMKSIVQELLKKWIATKNDDNSVWVIFEEELKIPSCILQKRDGTHGYLASDLAAIKYRMQNWNPEKIVYFVDVRQQLHLKQAFTIAKKAEWIDDDTQLIHAHNGFISLKDGAMSSRSGRIIKLDKLLDEAELRAEKIILEKRDDISGEELKKLSKIIGIWAIKYWYLKKSRETDVVFDWDEFMTFEGNSGPYIQYAYVRANRILEKYWSIIPKQQGGKFENSEEIELFKALQNYKEILLKTAETNMPHHLCGYTYDLTKKFNSFYNGVHILNEEDETKKIIRLQLIDLFTEVLKESFGLLGIDMPDKM